MTLDATGVVVAALALVGVLSTALVTAGVALVVDLRRTRLQSHRVFLHNRQLVDHIYRGNPPPPPPPPEGIWT